MRNTVTKLDQRYAGGHHFKYCVDFVFKQHEDFINKRNWCWETWGPGCELKFIDLESKPAWAWITDTHRIRLYFKDDAEVNWYKLRWE